MIKISDHFDGSRYHNQQAQKRKTLEIYCWLLTRNPPPWPKINLEPKPIEFTRVDKNELRVTFINHATCLIQVEGMNILTDPIWSERVGPFWLGPKRVCPPGVKFEDLPPIDLVLVSHNHYDHMDLTTLEKLQKYHKPQFFVGLGNKRYLENYVETITELDWWDSVSIKQPLSLYFVPAQHFSARGLFDYNKALWGGFVIKGRTHRIYFAGDTGYGPHFKEIREKLDTPTFSILPIGAFKPEKIMQPIHMSPSEAVQAYQDLGTKKALAIHFGTFQLTDEFFNEPIEQLQKTLQQYHLSSDDFWVLQPGEGRMVN